MIFTSCSNTLKLLHFCNPLELEVVELVADFLWAALPQSKASQRKQYETVVGSLSKILRSILAATRAATSISAFVFHLHCFSENKSLAGSKHPDS